MTDVKIGLETHVQLSTDSKLLCGCENSQEGEPNTRVCETCLGHPGSKPRLNEEVVEQATKVSLALRCEVNEQARFSRKTYFYPDMSKNFQTTQFDVPVGEEGNYQVKLEDDKKKVGIRRLHIEEDPAKLEHVGGSVGSSDYSLVDYNRAGTPLLEIVTEPDFESPQEARAYLQQLARTLEYLGVYSSDSSFSIKSDANISIDGGSRVEVKNITGTKEVEKALSYEISRQRQLSRRGGEVEQETRNFNSSTGATEAMRKKEAEEDYGYIVEPDLTVQELDDEYVRSVGDSIPELPREKLERFMESYPVSEKLAEALIVDPDMADDFEELAETHDPELVASWMTGEIRKTLNYNEQSYSGSELKLEWIEHLVSLLEDDRITERNAELVLREIVEDPRDPRSVIREENLLKAEKSAVEEAVDEAIDSNQEAVDDYLGGEDESLNFLVGQVMQSSGGRADPKDARKMLKSRLDEMEAD